MATFVFINNFRTTLAAAINTTATSITLTSSAGLPTLGVGQQMPLTLNDAATGTIFEIVYVTAITGATLTVLRAQEGTTAQNWAIGDYAFVGPTAGTIAPAQYLITSLSANTALTQAQAGTILASGTITLTLPSGNTYPGIAYDIVNVGSGVITVVPSGSDTIGPASLTSVTISQDGQSVTLQSNGASPANWVKAAGSYDTTYVYYTTSTTSLSASTATNIIWPTKVTDVLSEYNDTTGVFTPKESGYYLISPIIGLSTNVAGAFSISATSATVGTIIAAGSANDGYAGSLLIYLTKGTAYYIVGYVNLAATMAPVEDNTAYGAGNLLSIRRILP